MKSSLLLFSVFMTGIVISISCNKDVNPATPVPVDSLKSVLPKQIIYAYTNPNDTSYTLVESIKYDTANHSIQMYRDDTTNSNPYDVLDVSYAFNSDGYLTGYKTSDDYKILLAEVTTIKRGSDNKIIYIASHLNDNSGTDTTFYNYQLISGNTVVTTVGNEYEDETLTDSFTDTYTFNSSNVLISATQGRFSNALYSFTYNTNSSLKSFQTKSPDFTYNANFSYGSSGIADGTTDDFLQTVLGKDYYLPDIRFLDAYIDHLNGDFDFLGISLTDPYHVSSGTGLEVVNGESSTDISNYTYLANAQGNVSKITVSGNDGTHQVVTFKY